MTTKTYQSMEGKSMDLAGEQKHLSVLGFEEVGRVSERSVSPFVAVLRSLLGRLVVVFSS